MSEISDTLKSKIKIHLKEKKIEDILLSWTLDGTYEEKKYTYDVLKNMDYIIENFNLIRKIKNKEEQLSSSNIKKNLFYLVLSNLNDDKYNLQKANDMNIITTRIWMITNLCLTCDNSTFDECLKYLKDCFNSNVDEYTKFFSVEGILNCINSELNDYYDKIHRFFKDINLLGNLNNTPSENIERYKWCLLLWYIKNERYYEEGLFSNNIKLFKTKVIGAFESESFETKSNLLYCYGSIPIYCYIKKVIELFENMLRNEETIKFKRFNLIFYLNLVRTCIGIRYIEADNIENEKELLHILLFRLLKILRNYNDPIWNVVKKEILRAFRKYHSIFKSKIIIDDLSEELLNTDKNVVIEACKTLHTFNSPQLCTNIILDSLNNEISRVGYEASNDIVIALSSSLKWMNNKNNHILESLEEQMHRGSTDIIRNTSRRIISEMGGSNAIKKLDFRNTLNNNYSCRIDKAQNDVEKLFTSTINDAKHGFRVSLIMDIIVFLVGIILICVSGFIAIINNETENWAGITATGGTGVLTILYSLFLSKPREKVKQAVTHLMYLKIIFLGYIRELNQIDQCFNQNLIESDSMPTDDIKVYSDSINFVMNSCVQLLSNSKNNIELLQNKLNDNENNINKYATTDELVKYFRKENENDILEKITENNIDGEILESMDRSGWIELGVDSSIKQAKIQKDIKDIVV